MKRLATGIGVSILLFAPAASAQILVAGEGPVVYGHHHLNTTNMAAEKKFFADTLGGTVAKIGSGAREQEIVKFPNVLIFFTQKAPTGGSIGTTVNHVGFSVPDLRPVVAKIKANGFKMITADSVAANVKVTDDIAAASPTTNIAFALGPDDVKVEFVEVKAQKIPIQLNHIHFFGQMNTDMQAWYAKTFGAKMLPANPGSAFVVDQLPGVSLNFSRRRRRRRSARPAGRSIISASRSKISKRSRKSSKPKASNWIAPTRRCRSSALRSRSSKIPGERILK